MKCRHCEYEYDVNKYYKYGTDIQAKKGDFWEIVGCRDEDVDSYQAERKEHTTLYICPVCNLITIDD